MNLSEIGSEIHRRRVAAGLLQIHIARLAGLSRVTINQLENGKLTDLGYAKLKAVMDLLGMNMATTQPVGVSNALAVAARSISTSYKEVVTPAMLSHMLRSGDAPEQFQPHLMALLDETPLSIVVQAIGEAATPAVQPKDIMKHMGKWAQQWNTCRTVWS